MSHLFNNAFLKTMSIEGKFSNDKDDPGGQTYMGISHTYWPEWEGWKAVERTDWESADKLVKNFYRINFWNRFQGDKLGAISPFIAYEVFDTAVNVGLKKAVEFLQEGYNVGSGQDYTLTVDGLIGPKTLSTIKRYLSSQPGSPEINLEILLNCMNGEQYIYYKANPLHKKYRGWFRRL